MATQLWSSYIFSILDIPCAYHCVLLNISALSLPQKIKILTDDNELELVQRVMLSKIPTGKYVYSVSKTKKGMEILLKESEIEKYISSRLWIIIE